MPREPCRSKKRGLRLDDGDHPGEGLDRGERELLQPVHRVGQSPGVEQLRMRVDARAEPAAAGHRVLESATE